MEQANNIQVLMQKLEVEKKRLKTAIQKDLPFEQTKPIQQRISQLEKSIAAALHQNDPLLKP